MEKDDQLNKVLSNIDQLRDIVSIFSFNTDVDMIAADQLFKKLSEDIKPILDGRFKVKLGRENRPVVCVDTGEWFKSAEEVSRIYGCSKQTIRVSCITKTKVAKIGKFFVFADESD